MFERKLRHSRPDHFVSAKTDRPVPARNPQLREALVRASLDPSVRSIGYVASADVEAVPVELDAVTIVRDGGERYFLDVVAARPVRDIDEEGLVLVALDRLGLRPLTIGPEDLAAEPVRSNCRAVWSYNGRAVPVGLRLRVLETLEQEGPMSLGLLLENVRSDHDPAPAVMALACADALELDLTSRPLGPATHGGGGGHLRGRGAARASAQADAGPGHVRDYGGSLAGMGPAGLGVLRIGFWPALAAAHARNGEATRQRHLRRL
jgi:hypothetical protein